MQQGWLQAALVRHVSPMCRPVHISSQPDPIPHWDEVMLYHHMLMRILCLQSILIEHQDFDRASEPMQIMQMLTQEFYSTSSTPGSESAKYCTVVPKCPPRL